MIIRPAAASDRDAWRELFVAYGVFYETRFDAEITSGVWHWLMDAAHEVKAVVAELDGEIVGFAHYRRLADTFTASASWNLDDLFVSPVARGRGVATALIQSVAAKAGERGGGMVRWITAADNVTAQRLYDTLAQRADWVTYELETPANSAATPSAAASPAPMNSAPANSAATNSAPVSRAPANPMPASPAPGIAEAETT